MTCIKYKEYEVKTKMVQEQWLQLKMKFLFGYNVKIVMQGEGGEEGWRNWPHLWTGGITIFWGGVYGGVILSGDEQAFD